jgi:hypothetical protein
VRVCSECGGDCDPHVDSRERTALQEAVLRAAVAMARTDMGSDAIEYRIDDVCDAVDALLAAEPVWGEVK